MSSHTRKYLKIPGKRFVITKRIIEDAISNTKSNSEAARWLEVTYNTYKKWAKYYDVFEQHKNQSGVGVKRTRINTKYKLDDILEGKYPDYPKYQLKRRLIDSGYMEEECSICSWNEKRITDEVICLRLDFIDGNSNNYNFENLRILCSNCYFTNVGNFINAKKFCQ
tara:strand:- start:156 stop:656 length:501 start_codon:yes stop_codon:yes gene_type:complete